MTIAVISLTRFVSPPVWIWTLLLAPSVRKTVLRATNSASAASLFIRVHGPSRPKNLLLQRSPFRLLSCTGMLCMTPVNVMFYSSVGMNEFIMTVVL